jgi:hypothetical protein
MPIPAACRHIQDEIDGLLQERTQLQDELKHAGAEEKPELLRDIKAINRRLVGLQKQLADCIVAKPSSPPIEGIFTGTSELTTTYSSAPGPFYNDVRFKLLINGERTGITLTSFPTIKVLFDTPLGSNSHRWRCWKLRSRRCDYADHPALRSQHRHPRLRGRFGPQSCAVDRPAWLAHHPRTVRRRHAHR